ncbi:MAG: hypothetical protein ABJB86_07735 [Bacteroidota bacterium]
MDTEQYLRIKFPVTTANISSKEFRAILENGIEKAAASNIIERTDVRYFLEYIIVLGQAFDTEPSNEWAVDILGIRNLAGSEKIKRMLRTYSLTQES